MRRTSSGGGADVAVCMNADYPDDLCVCVCVCVCERERERERES